MSQVIVYAMEYPAVDLPVTIELTEEAANELLRMLRNTPKKKRPEAIVELTKKLKEVL
jgi:hypothetical protein